ncbi:MAG: hypothetical protein ACE5H9_06035 [Anaerolineae bacterium]
MAHYEIREVIRRWGQSRLTPEQAIGQILLILLSLHKRLLKLESTRRQSDR